MPKRDANETTEMLVRATLGVKRIRGESLLGSPALKQKFRQAKRQAGASRKRA